MLGHGEESRGCYPCSWQRKHCKIRWSYKESDHRRLTCGREISKEKIRKIYLPCRCNHVQSRSHFHGRHICLLQIFLANGGTWFPIVYQLTPSFSFSQYGFGYIWWTGWRISTFGNVLHICSLCRRCCKSDSFFSLIPRKSFPQLIINNNLFISHKSVLLLINQPQLITFS